MASLLDMVAASVKLTRRGNAYWGPCPFHSPDKTGSFKVELRQGKERFYCFGCEAKGDAVDWLRLTRKMSYAEAKRILGEECARPDPALLAARQAKRQRQNAIDAYRDAHPHCVCPDWLLDFSCEYPRSTGPPKA